MPELLSADRLPAILAEIQSCTAAFGVEGAAKIRILEQREEKRFTNFYRFEVLPVADSASGATCAWLRVVKNKPAEEARRSLAKQHAILAAIDSGFRAYQEGATRLNCCTPILFLESHCALVTRECDGKLFNRSLTRSLPRLARKRLVGEFWSAGTWLKAFHAFFRHEVSEEEKARFVAQFHGQFGQDRILEPDIVTLCHCDYTPRNIFVQSGSVEVIDFCGTRPGLAAHDVEFFKDYVLDARFNGLYRRSFKDELLDAFVSGYRDFQPTAVAEEELIENVLEACSGDAVLR